MPRPRFKKLDETRRETLMVAAATAFSEHGYHGASINQILDAAGLSKGVAYYYFEDKADLFATTVEHYFEQFHLPIKASIDKLTADNFWEMLEIIYREPFLQTIDKPYMFGVMKAATRVDPDDPIRERITPIIQVTFQWLGGIVIKGQEFGVIRSDLPDELLYGFITAIDAVVDDYLLEGDAPLTEASITQTHKLTIDAFRRLLSP